MGLKDLKYIDTKVSMYFDYQKNRQIDRRHAE